MARTASSPLESSEKVYGWFSGRSASGSSGLMVTDGRYIAPRARLYNGESKVGASLACKLH